MVFTRKNLFLFIVIATFFAITLPAAAQLSSDVVPDDLSGSTPQYDTGPSANDISIQVYPENPSAFQTVTLRTDSDYIDLNRYHATWFVDGKKIADGIGERTATFKTRGYGQKTNVIVLVQLPDTLIKKTFSFEPQDMTLTWEAADAYVPPFYQGKKLIPREGIIKAIAIPNFKDASGLPFTPSIGVYRWERNGNVVSTATGYSKDSYTFKNNKIRSTEEISVTASDASNNHQATQTITVVTYNPKILFYEKNSKTGIISPFAKRTLDLFGNATNIIAEPFFFSTIQNNINQLSFNWLMNNNPITLTDTANKKSINLQNPGGSGAATLGLGITNPNSIFQAAQSQLSIIFNK